MNFILTTDCCRWITNVAVLSRDSHKCERQPHLPVRGKHRGRPHYLHGQLSLGIFGSLQVKSELFLLDDMLRTQKRDT